EFANNTLGLCKSTKESVRPFVPDLWVQILWSILFTFMVFGAVFGNIMVIYIILKVKNMRTKTNLFFLNLSVADLMMATLNAMFNFIYMLNSNWIFGYTYCKISNFAANLTVSASVFTITATSID
ncbi:tachykinin-like peptides receptor 86C, partial [Dinothrombium tinctorium]